MADGELKPVLEPLSSNPSPSRLINTGSKSLYEVMFGFGMTMFESGRVHRMETDPTYLEWLGQARYHLGDWWEGYHIPLVVYGVLDLAFPRMPEKYKVGAAVFAANAFVGAVEMGYILNDYPQPWDIPIATAFSLFYAGFHHFLSRIGLHDSARDMLQNRSLFRDS